MKFLLVFGRLNILDISDVFQEKISDMWED